MKDQAFASLHTVEEAQSILENRFSAYEKIEQIPSIHSVGRVLAEDIYSDTNLPGYRRAAMDGYAVRVEDTYGASDTSPKRLKLIGEIDIGAISSLDITNGEALKVSTGCNIPISASGVVREEDTEELGSIIEIYTPISPDRNVSLENEDVATGDLVLKHGTILKPWDVALLLSLEIQKVNVIAKPKVAVLSNGNELIQPGNDKKPAQVIDSNRPALVNWLKLQGCEIIASSTSKDDSQMIKEKIQGFCNIADLIITIGGTSVGTKDFLPKVINEIGELWVHGVALRPGKPVALGKVGFDGNSVPIISLPGNPLAAMINYHLFVSFILKKWTKLPELISEKMMVRLVDKIPSKVGTRDFVRLVQADDGAKLLRISGSSILSSLVKADYLLDIPYNLEGYNAGDTVEVFKLR